MRDEHPSAGDEIPPASELIEVHVRDLGQLLNSMDPSPFHERDLDPEAEEFILSSAKELQSEGPIALVVYLDQPSGLAEECRTLGDAVRVHFSRRSQSSRRELRQLLRRGRTSLVIGLLFVAASLVAGDLVVRLMGARPLAQILRESFLIGGWVAMWRPLEIFLYDWWPLLTERRIYDRLSELALRVVYAGSGTVPQQSSSTHGS